MLASIASQASNQQQHEEWPMTTPPPLVADHVVLVDDAGNPTGTAPRATVHGAETPLHLAFSCYVYRADGLVLVTRRAITKRTWPGVWTNSVCGHPRAGEAMPDAVARHASHELGLTIRDVRVVLPGFRYRAVDAAGVVENEICPVHVALTDDTPVPRPDEVMDLRWVDPEDLARAVTAAPWAFSPWMVEQLGLGVPAPGAGR
jgi:isopentenyl-diphosphate Delta-isomerase